MRAWIILGALSISALTGAGCRALAGLDELSFEETSGSATSGGGSGGEGVGSGAQSSGSAGSGSGSGGMTGSGGMAGAGGAAGAGGMGGGGGIVSMGPEACGDGADNDSDGLIDCADDECTPGYECVDNAPAGWTFLRMRTIPFPSNNAVPCTEGGSPSKYFLNPTPTECLDCKCNTPMNGCTAPEISCYLGSSDCSGMPGLVYRGIDNGCAAVGAVVPDGTPVSCQITAPSELEAGVACSPTGGGVINAELWEQEAHVCPAVSKGSGCAQSQVCVRKAADGYQGACIVMTGNVACPAAWPSPLTVYNDAVDNRSCTACDCSNVTLSCANEGAYNVWDTDACMLDPTGVNNFLGCVDVSTQLDASNGGGLQAYNAPPPDPSGSCFGGFPDGVIEPQEPRTICCKTN